MNAKVSDLYVNWEQSNFDSCKYTPKLLKKNWLSLHDIDSEPFPDEEQLRHKLVSTDLSVTSPKYGNDFSSLSDELVQGWCEFHSGNFLDAVSIARSCGVAGSYLGNVSTVIYAGYLETEQDKKLSLFNDVHERASEDAKHLKDCVNTFYMSPCSFGRYGESVFVGTALAKNIPIRFRSSIKKTLEINSDHPLALAGYGAFYAQIIGYSGRFLARATFGCSEKECHSLFSKALNIAEGSTIVRLEYAKALLMMDKKNKEAITLLELIINTTPIDAMQELDIKAARLLINEEQRGLHYRDRSFSSGRTS